MADAFVDVGITTDGQELLNTATDSLTADGWTPHEADPEVVLLETISPMAANAANVAAVVPPTIFRKFGTDLVNVPFKDGAPASTTSTWVLTDTVGHTIPAGTYVQVGDFFFATTVDTVVAPASGTATGVVLRAIEDGAAQNGLTGTASMVNSIAWVATVTLAAATTGGADAEDDTAYQNRLRTELTLIGPRPITAQDFADFALNTPDVVIGRATAFDGYEPFVNLLSTNQASLETDTTGWTAGASTSIARTTSAHDDGAAALQLTRNSTTGNAYAVGTEVPAQPGQTYTVMAEFKAAATPRSCLVDVAFYDVAHAVIGIFHAGTAVADTTSGWTQVSSTAVAPAGTAYVGPVVEALAAVATEVHYVDNIGVKRVPFDQASNAVWSPGGVSSLNTPRTVTVAATDAAGEALSADAKAAIRDTLVALRETNFIVHVIDPAYYTGADIAISYTVAIYDTFDGPTLIDAVNAKLATALSPLLWGQPQFGNQTKWFNDLVVRHNTLVGIVESVEGVRYCGTLTINGGSGDFTMNGPVALPNVAAADITGAVI